MVAPELPVRLMDLVEPEPDGQSLEITMQLGVVVGQIVL